MSVREARQLILIASAASFCAGAFIASVIAILIWGMNT